MLRTVAFFTLLGLVVGARLVAAAGEAVMDAFNLGGA